MKLEAQEMGFSPKISATLAEIEIDDTGVINDTHGAIGLICIALTTTGGLGYHRSTQRYLMFWRWVIVSEWRLQGACRNENDGNFPQW